MPKYKKHKVRYQDYLEVERCFLCAFYTDADPCNACIKSANPAHKPDDMVDSYFQPKEVA